MLITCVGQLSRPSVPDLPGLTSFTGPSAIQFVPAIAPEVAHLTAFQRSAPWIAQVKEYQQRCAHLDLGDFELV